MRCRHNFKERLVQLVISVSLPEDQCAEWLAGIKGWAQQNQLSLQ